MISWIQFIVYTYVIGQPGTDGKDGKDGQDGRDGFAGPPGDRCVQPASD